MSQKSFRDTTALSRDPQYCTYPARSCHSFSLILLPLPPALSGPLFCLTSACPSLLGARTRRCNPYSIWKLFPFFLCFWVVSIALCLCLRSPVESFHCFRYNGVICFAVWLTGMMLGGGCGRELAHWIIHGRPEKDMYGYDIRYVYVCTTFNP